MLVLTNLTVYYFVLAFIWQESLDIHLGLDPLGLHFVFDRRAGVTGVMMTYSVAFGAVLVALGFVYYATRLWFSIRQQLQSGMGRTSTQDLEAIVASGDYQLIMRSALFASSCLAHVSQRRACPPQSHEQNRDYCDCLLVLLRGPGSHATLLDCLPQRPVYRFVNRKSP
jgi:hypothetical protein